MNLEWASVIREAGHRLGRDLSVYDEAFLVKALEKRAAATARPTPAAYLGLLSENSAEEQALLQSLTITYSEFFRNPLTFALLEELVLPRLLDAREKTGRAELRIWSAGCAAGQEAYSLAMLLDELVTRRGGAPAFRIIATDNAAPELAAARWGVYAAATLQNVRLRQLRTYFTPAGDAYAISGRLREWIDFSSYDLLDENTICPPTSIYGDFDLVLCCNLLFYYQPAIRQFILDRLFHCLPPNGYLVTGEAEKDLVGKVAGLRAVAPPAAVFQKTA